MTSRIGALIQDAELRSAAWINDLPEQSRKKAVATGINVVCAQLVKRKTPICPTAKVVSEEGLKRDPRFPQPQTIYNSYSYILNVWNDSYQLIMNPNADPLPQTHEAMQIDTSTMDAETGNLVEHLKALIAELTHRCNMLKRIITDSIPVGAGLAPTGSDSEMAVQALKEWLDNIRNGHFTLDELGLRTTSKTPIGARVMERGLYDRLAAFAEDAIRISSASRASQLDVD